MWNAFGRPVIRHRRLALAVNLRKARPQRIERACEIGGIHGRAAIDDGLQVAAVRGREFRRRHQPIHHGGRGEHADAREAVHKRGDLSRIEAAAFRHDVVRSLRKMHEPPEP